MFEMKFDEKLKEFEDSNPVSLEEHVLSRRRKKKKKKFTCLPALVHFMCLEALFLSGGLKLFIIFSLNSPCW